ncbi:hypothetical protein QUF58_01775 [Anaerolineales bacterium HSG24]|nr:hypothetical protein [Anaerolineales bacterium HSG24]
MAEQTPFIRFVVAKLDERSWSRNKLAREAGLSNTLVHKILSPKNLRESYIPISQRACIRIAKALAEPPEKMLALGGYLPFGSDRVDELASLAKLLEEDRFETLLRFAQFLLDQQRIERSREQVKAENNRRERSIPTSI